MNTKYLETLKSFYGRQLLNNTLPFWFPRSVDAEYGGYLLMRDADGSLIDDDKAVWIQGRAAWLLSTLYNTLEKREEWLQGAKAGIDFLLEHCFDADGRMFFHVTREGRPLRKRRYFFQKRLLLLLLLLMQKPPAMKRLQPKPVSFSAFVCSMHQVKNNCHLNLKIPARPKALAFP